MPESTISPQSGTKNLATVEGKGRGGRSGVEWRCEKGRGSPEAEFLDVIRTKVLRFSSLLFTVTSTNGFYSCPP